MTTERQKRLQAVANKRFKVIVPHDDQPHEYIALLRHCNKEVAVLASTGKKRNRTWKCVKTIGLTGALEPSGDNAYYDARYELLNELYDRISLTHPDLMPSDSDA